MTNREKYKEEILDVACAGYSIALSRQTGKLVPCDPLRCSECEFNNGIDGCVNELKHWCNSEYKEPEIDWSKVKVDTPILVRTSETDRWNKRYFAKYENGFVYAWSFGATSWSIDRKNNAAQWNFAKLAESEE